MRITPGLSRSNALGRPAAACLLLLIALLSFQTPCAAAPIQDIVFADFESPNYGQWTTTGTAFGDGPTRGTLPGQMAVSGFKGKQLVDSFHGGDATTGTLTSPPFKIEHPYIAFLIGGGALEGKTCMNLLVDDKIIHTSTGTNTQPGGQELLVGAHWDVRELLGKSARLQIVDDAKDGWGHILVDHIVFTDNPALALSPATSRTFVAEQKLLLLPVKNGAPMRRLKIISAGQSVREFTIEAADGPPDWWAVLDISAWQGKTLQVQLDQLPDDSKFLASLHQSNSTPEADQLYHERLRPQFHFSPSRGWLNDPNGLVFFNGEYHLFFQHNPYATRWGNMHWGHAVSKDLIRWNELPIALYPDSLGTMFSGSAVVDWKNTSGLGAPGKPALILTYTADQKSVQCLASSTDGRNFTKYPNNPIVQMISPGNRDPKVFWHEPTQHWVMALYVGYPVPKKGGQPKFPDRHTIHILTSPNLKEWTDASQVEGLYECPDLFPLPVDGDPKNIKWVLTAASSEYILGQFDGKVFTPETPKLKGHLGRGFYAAQTFSDIPANDGRRIMIGWFQTPSPAMPFNQSMSVPLELKLLSTPQGPRLSYLPVRELESLRTRSTHVGLTELKSGAQLAADGASEQLDIRLEFEPTPTSVTEIMINGATLRYDARNEQLSVNDHKAPAPLRNGRQRLIVLVDRNSLEIFASDGLAYVPFPFIPKDRNSSVHISADGGNVKIHSLDIHSLKSSWDLPR
jgi:fructan beta-fructosidase